MKKNIKGFTLIELLVVIAIIGLLSTLAVVSLNSARAKARDARRSSDLKQIATAMELYYSNNNSYPIGTGVASDANCVNNGIFHYGAAAPFTICGSGAIAGVIRDATNIYLNRIPIDPTNSTTYRYYQGAQASNLVYCIYAQLETEPAATLYFKCESTGSCYKTNTVCP